MIPHLIRFLRQKNARFFEDVEFIGRDIVRDFVFEEEYVNIPTSIISIDQDPNSDFDQDIKNQDNLKKPLIHEIILEEKNSTTSRTHTIKKIH